MSGRTKFESGIDAGGGAEVETRNGGDASRRRRRRSAFGRGATLSGVLAFAVAVGGAAIAAIAAIERDEDAAALEEAFFETLGRCESPLLIERDAAEDALFERFAEFEPIWQDRRFLTNGEIGAEARQRFELAEARYRERAFDECVDAFETTFEIVAPEELEEKSQNVDLRTKERGEEDAGKGEKDEKDGGQENGARGRVRLAWRAPLRIVYLTPDWSAFERRDVDGSRWRAGGRFSAPELAPEFDASELTIETTWERVERQDATETVGGEIAGIGAVSENGETTAVGVFEGVVGGDFRVWSLPLGKAEPIGRNKENGENGENEGKRNEKENGAANDFGEFDGFGDPGVQDDWNVSDANSDSEDFSGSDGGDFPTTFQSGDAIATVGKTIFQENGETTARVRFEFLEAFDAFDSHRVWCDERDFALTIGDGGDDGGEKSEIAGESQERRKKTRWAPIRLRAGERSERGVSFELDFPNETAIREAVEEGRARLCCRIPRFFFWVKVEVAGAEKKVE